MHQWTIERQQTLLSHDIGMIGHNGRAFGRFEQMDDIHHWPREMKVDDVGLARQLLELLDYR